jgi:SOS-response transcriptional repressor LexA
MRGGQVPRFVDYYSPMNGIGARIKLARKRKGLTQEALASLCGWEGNSRIGNYEKDTREPSAQDMQAIAKALGVLAGWLWTGEGPESPHEHGGSNVGPAHHIGAKVPVISFVTAGSWDTAHDPFPATMADEWRLCPVPHGPHTYALRVAGDSMTSPYPGARSFPEGCLIFVDPDRLDPPSGSPIIAKLSGGDEVTFKLLIRDAGRVFLRAINPNYPPIMDEFRVLGSIIGKWEDV